MIFLCLSKWNHEIFSPRPKNKRNSPQESFLYFRKQKPRKTLLYFPQKIAVLMFWETFYISGSNIPCSKIKNFVYFSYKEAKFSKS